MALTSGMKERVDCILVVRMEIIDGIVNTVMKCIHKVEVTVMTSRLLASQVELCCVDAVSRLVIMK